MGRRQRRLRRTERARLRSGATRHKLVAGRTGSVHRKKLATYRKDPT